MGQDALGLDVTRKYGDPQYSRYVRPPPPMNDARPNRSTRKTWNFKLTRWDSSQHFGVDVSVGMLCVSFRRIGA
ncbi:hypothetical protein PC128_g25387 [Phytophthora cactorum]|nr:hypothetical protein PC120_g20987 [Phytophthora cactorum]KAG3046962.1 hypothetical protein PC121_g20350 [Phytophthora cactorum]KAG3139266.1 hypothetical protein PC128_g25387 [Phytophthora cactorum]